METVLLVVVIMVERGLCGLTRLPKPHKEDPMNIA